MALTNAERQKMYRERMRTKNPAKYEEIKRKNAERNKKRKNIKECSEKVKELKRKQWRVSQKRHREKISNSIIDEENDTSNFHEDSSAEMYAEIKRSKRRWAYQKMTYEVKIRNMTKEIKSLKKKCKRYMQKNKKLIKLVDDLKSRNSELEEIIPSQPNVPIQDMTPLSKSNSFIEENLPNISNDQKEKIKKQLLTHNVLVNAIQDTYTETKKNDERNVLKRILDKDIVKKYNRKSEITKSVLGLKGRVRQRRQLIKKNNSIINEIISFYNRDDVSRATAGKKEFKTKGKIKKQKRYLLNSLKQLYKKYREEGGRAKKSSFQKYKPFYVVAPKLSDRETCGCIKHENFFIKAKKLYSLKLILNTDINELISQVVCDIINNKYCAYGECVLCKNSYFKFEEGNCDINESVTWEEFSLQSHEYTNKKDGKTTTTRKMEKKEINGNIKSLEESFNIELKMMRKHMFNIRHQYSQYSLCIQNLKPTEVAIHIDFSENYMCKLGTEVQSMHFGASKSQVTIHTGVLYVKDKKPLSFASLSPSHEHGPEAIWAHLNPILNYVKEIPFVDAVHFFSDGPATQYKQKKNFYLFLKLTKMMGFPYSTWNFSESAHGKGAADGVGGGLKRRLDDFVKHGTDVPDAYTAYTLLKNSDTSVMIFYISEDDISQILIEEDLTPVPKTMNIHQITNTEITNCLRFRCLSCFCGDVYRGYCECFDVKNHQLVKGTDYKVETKKSNLKRKISEEDEINPQQNKKKQKKVTILSEVRFTAENMAYDNLLHHRPTNLQNMQKLDKDFDLSINPYKENINYDNPQASTSGICQPKKRTRSKEKRRRVSTNNPYDSTTDEDDNYSVHDSSEGDYYEDQLNDTESNIEYNDSIINTSRAGREEIVKETRMKEKTKGTRMNEDIKEREIEEKITGLEVNEDIKDTGMEEKLAEVGMSENIKETGIEANIGEVAMNEDFKIRETEKNITDLGVNENIKENTNEMEMKDDVKKTEIDDNISLVRNNEDIKVKWIEENKQESGLTQNIEDRGKEGNIIGTGTPDNSVVTRMKDNVSKNIYFNVGDSVIVRYYQNKWKYYIGFIEQITTKENYKENDNTFYTIRFLKTIKKPTLKFMPTRKIDRDVVPEINIVKKVELSFNTKTYTLNDDDCGNETYFS